MCIWVEDADRLELDSKELGIVYYNRTITDFIKESTCLGLAGIKGQGKTFLIKVKRKYITEKDNSIICLPNGRIVDIIDSSLSIDKSLYRFLSDYNVWVKLWKFSIGVTILSYFDISNYCDVEALKPLTKKIVLEKNERFEVTTIFKKILSFSLSDFKNILDDTYIIIESLKKINQAVCIFIDKLDQGFSEYLNSLGDYSFLRTSAKNINFWQYSQYSLAEAAYDTLTSINQHIKVYFTIRQEAMTKSYELNNNKARNIEAYISVLDYKKSDLKEMYKLYIKNEDQSKLHADITSNVDPSYAFLGFSSVRHSYLDFEVYEDVFDYIYRHSFKRPYDIMRICRNLYMTGNEKRTISYNEFRHQVNAVSNTLYNFYLQELSIFLPYKINEIEELIKMVPHNILNIKLVKTICKNFCKLVGENENCTLECSKCDTVKPFSILYNIGLLGISSKHEADINPKIAFVDIGQKINELNTSILPASDFYYLHPALSNKVRDLRAYKGVKYSQSHFQIVGDGNEINPHQKNNIIQEINDTIKKTKNKKKNI